MITPRCSFCNCYRSPLAAPLGNNPTRVFICAECATAALNTIAQAEEPAPTAEPYLFDRIIAEVNERRAAQLSHSLIYKEETNA